MIPYVQHYVNKMSEPVKQQVRNVIQTALDLIDDDLNWTDEFCADEYGDRCDYADPQADQFSGVAAIGLACIKQKAPLAVKNEVYMHVERVNNDLVCFINMRGHEAMKAAFAKALEAL